MFRMLLTSANIETVYTAKLPANIAAIHSPTGQPYTHAHAHPAQTNEQTQQYRSHDTRPLSDQPASYNLQATASNNARSSAPSMSSIYNKPLPVVQRSIGEALGGSHSGQDSPVMNETLSVIDEHITDLSTPRQSLAPPQILSEDSESEYSSNMERASYLAGPETDEEDNNVPTKDEVLRWDHMQVSAHLRSIGVDSRHCDIFEEQEISGDVLMEMDQAFLQMKEFDFGVMGRRLKTWHKIRDFQNEVLGTQQRSRQNSTTRVASHDSTGRAPSRAASGPTSILPRIPSLSERPGLTIRSSQQGMPSVGSQLPSPVTSSNGATRISAGNGTPPTSWRASMIPDSPSRPSAAQVRELSHSRRHSSIDFGKAPNLDFTGNSVASTASPHKKHSSFDREWSAVPATPTSTNVTSPSIYTTNVVRKQESLDMSANSPLLTPAPNLDLDRGYFSGNEIDNRKSRTGLRKSTQDSSGHSRQSSLLDDPRKTAPFAKRHSRLSSVDSSRDYLSTITSPAAKAYHSSSYKGRFRSASARGPTLKNPTSGHSPTVTNLEAEKNTSAPSTGTEQSFASKISIPAKARKLMGLRASSEAVTDNEKASASSSQNILASPLEESPIASPADGSNTPSATSRSFDYEGNETTTSKDQLGSGLTVTQPQRTKPKAKQQTSAYTRGLRRVTPEEARRTCDYHGWMKKKSSALMTTWKPRLFVLHGRRLAYYYSEDDKEERGIIDISGHKVLVANSDPFITLHATITGSKTSALPSPTSADTSPHLPKSPTGQPFFFKLVPPKAGMSRAVQFTKPTIHYFQVDSAPIGRKWMGEIMKATIMHDLSTFETTNKQKTITLAKAKARKERPPALKNEEDLAPDVPEKDNKENEENGLNISGLELEIAHLQAALQSEQELAATETNNAPAEVPPPSTATATTSS